MNLACLHLPASTAIEVVTVISVMKRGVCLAVITQEMIQVAVMRGVCHDTSAKYPSCMIVILHTHRVGVSVTVGSRWWVIVL